MERQAKRLPRMTGGFTLVELMVAMAIGLFLLIGLISLLVTTSQSRTELDKTGRQIENGRYALQLLMEDAAHAGYMGAYMPSKVVYGAPDPCTPSAADFDPASTPDPTVPVFVYGYDGATAVPGSCSAIITNRLAGTAILVVRRVSTTAVAVGAAAAGETYLQTAACPPIPIGKAFVVSSSTADFSLLQKDCTTAGFLNKYMVHIYFVSSCNVCTPASDGIPTLKLAEFVGGAMTVTPLTEGIQDLQMDFGIDTNGDGSPDCNVGNPSSTSTPAVSATCPTPGSYTWSTPATNWSNVVTIKLYVLARTLEPSVDWTDTRTYDMGIAGVTAAFNDHYKRHVSTALARVTNVSGRREQP